MQPKALLGKRYSCFKCSCKFYDLNRPEPLCPRCGADQREDPTPDPRVAVMARYKSSRVAPPAPDDSLLDEPNEDEDLEFDDFDDDEEEDPGFDEDEEPDEED